MQKPFAPDTRTAQSVTLPFERAKLFREICEASGVAFIAQHGAERQQRIFPDCVPADFEALKAMFAEKNGTPIL